MACDMRRPFVTRRAFGKPVESDRSADEVRALSAGANKEEPEVDPEKAPAVMVHSVLSINERLERITEVTVVGPINHSQEMLKRTVLAKLDYVLAKKAAPPRR